MNRSQRINWWSYIVAIFLLFFAGVLDLFAGDNIGVDNSGSIVLGVYPSRERLAHDRFTQVTEVIALPHAFIDGIIEVAANNMDILPQL